MTNIRNLVTRTGRTGHCCDLFILHKGAVINYDLEGGGSISENSQKTFKSPPIQEIKIQTPSRFQRIISDPNTSLKRENIHILVSNAYSICPSVIAQDLYQCLWLIQVPKTFKKLGVK